MNIVMVNPVHPDTPHISAVRAASFAWELSALGHRVILLTAPMDGLAAGMVDLNEHDWSTPLVLAAANPTRTSRPLPFPLRKLVTIWGMLLNGGSRGAWVGNAVRCITDLEPEFRPDVVWCTFGQLESVVAARRIAKQANGTWVLDVKDNWELYVPVGIRRLMAWRIRGWSAVTVNAEFNAAMARKWLGAEAAIIYSGIDAAFLSASTGFHVGKLNYVTVVGSTYSSEHLSTLLCGIKKWLLSCEAQTRDGFCIKYLGGDLARFKAVAGACIPDIRTETIGYLPTTQMADVCRLAVANLYVGYAATFHHKLMELLACQRPLIVCPGESEESRRLATQVGGILYEAASEDHVSESLAMAFSQDRVATDSSSIQALSWPRQAVKLEAVLVSSIGVSL